MLARIVAHAASSGEEVCGLLIGTPGCIEIALPTDNVALDPARAFEVDPVSLLRAHRDARRDGRRVIGHYHSHPSGSTRPSATDAAMAGEKGLLWLIVAGGDVGTWVTTAAGRVEGAFEAATLTVTS